MGYKGALNWHPIVALSGHFNNLGQVRTSLLLIWRRIRTRLIKPRWPFHHHARRKFCSWEVVKLITADGRTDKRNRDWTIIEMIYQVPYSVSIYKIWFDLASNPFSIQRGCEKGRCEDRGERAQCEDQIGCEKGRCEDWGERAQCEDQIGSSV